MQMSYDELKAMLGAVVDSFSHEPITTPWSACIDRKLFERAKLAAAQATEHAPPNPGEFNGTAMQTIAHVPPEDANIGALMNKLAKALDMTFNPQLSAKQPRVRGFLLMVWPFHVTSGTVYYTANADQQTVMRLMRDQLEKLGVKEEKSDD